MLSTAIKFITSKAAGPIASAVAAALLVALVFVLTAAKATEGVLHVQIAGLEKRVATTTGERDAARSDLSTCRANETTLSASVDAQNAGLKALKTESDRRVAEAEKAAQVARSASATALRKADQILAAKPTVDVCASADALILESLK